VTPNTNKIIPQMNLIYSILKCPFSSMPLPL
jgi:hypothetical protein